MRSLRFFLSYETWIDCPYIGPQLLRFCYGHRLVLSTLPWHSNGSYRCLSVELTFFPWPDIRGAPLRAVMHDMLWCKKWIPFCSSTVLYCLREIKCCGNTLMALYHLPTDLAIVKVPTIAAAHIFSRQISGSRLPRVIDEIVDHHKITADMMARWNVWLSYLFR